MARRMALVVAIAVTVVLGFALLAVAARGPGPGEADTSSADAAPVTTEVAVTEQPRQSGGSSATPLPSSERGDDDRWERRHEVDGRERERH